MSDAASVEQAGIAFAEYLQAYTAASVSLLGRWPTFVEEKDRYAETLEPGNLSAFLLGPELPEGLQVKGARTGTGISGTPRGAGTMAARSSRSRDGAPAEPAEPSAQEAQLRDQVERLSSKLRHEVAERSRANDESTRRGAQVQQSAREISSLNETAKRQSVQLEMARTQTMKLEEQLREATEYVDTADVRLVKERKAKYVWQQRAEKLQKRVAPLEREAEVLKDAVATTEELLRKARDRGEKAAARVAELEASEARLRKGATTATHTADKDREERAHAGLQLTLMADRRDELLETIERLEAEARERDQALESMDRARNEGEGLAHDERRLRHAAEAAKAAADDARAAAEEETREWRQRALYAEEQLRRQREHVAALVTQDGIREAEQRKLFDAVSELIARVQYLGELPAHQLGMSRVEALQHRDEALRHLKSLREAHALSTYPNQIVLHHSTMATGAAMINSATQAADALAARTSQPASQSASPRSQPASPRRKAGGSAGASPRQRAPAAAEEVAAALDATNGRPRPAKPAAMPAKAPSADGGATGEAGRRGEGSQRYGAWREQVEPSLGQPSPRGGLVHAGGAVSARPSPRGRARGGPEDPARAADGAKQPAAEWEKQKLLDMMAARDA